MWLITQDGYFSVVKKNGTSARPLCLRSRVRRDIENFLMAIDKKYKIEDSTGTDYKYRTYVSREDLIEYQIHIIKKLDYDNFKDSLKDVHPERLQTYMNLWSDSFGLQKVDMFNEKTPPRSYRIWS
jgi:hypothetical protein